VNNEEVRLGIVWYVLDCGRHSMRWSETAKAGSGSFAFRKPI
jgi:hypothetical protein